MLKPAQIATVFQIRVLAVYSKLAVKGTTALQITPVNRYIILRC